MRGSEGGEAALTPQESWGAIHTTMDKARSSIYLAGTSTILLLWGALTSVTYFFEYWLQTRGRRSGGAKPLGESAVLRHFHSSRDHRQRNHRAPGVNQERDERHQPGGRHSGLLFLDVSSSRRLVHSSGRGDVER